MLGRLGFDLAALSLASLLTVAQAPAPPTTEAIVHRVDRTQLMADVRELSSDQYQGRRTGTPGGLKARAWIRDAFAAIGLKPAGANGFTEPFGFTYQEDHAQGSSGRPVTTEYKDAANVLGSIPARRLARTTSSSARITITWASRATASTTAPTTMHPVLRRCWQRPAGSRRTRRAMRCCLRRSTPRSWG